MSKSTKTTSSRRGGASTASVKNSKLSTWLFVGALVFLAVSVTVIIVVANQPKTNGTNEPTNIATPTTPTPPVYMDAENATSFLMNNWRPYIIGGGSDILSSRQLVIPVLKTFSNTNTFGYSYDEYRMTNGTFDRVFLGNPVWKKFGAGYNKVFIFVNSNYTINAYGYATKGTALIIYRWSNTTYSAADVFDARILDVGAAERLGFNVTYV